MTTLPQTDMSAEQNQQLTSDPNSPPAHMVAQKDALLAAFRTHNVLSAEAIYNGGGDEGYIHFTEATALDGNPFPLAGYTITMPGDAKPKTLKQAFEDFAWDVIWHWHSGFENCEGGHGALTLDVTTAKVTLDHNDYVITEENSNLTF